MNSIISALTLVVGLGSVGQVFADGRADWKDYAWQSEAFGACPDADKNGLCHPFHEKWDWKRDQWVDFLYRADSRTGALQVRLRLTNNDRRDDDYVCVTALFVDAKGRDLFAFHENLHMNPKQVLDKTFTFTAVPAIWQEAAKVLIGSKQCRKGGSQDDDVFAGVTRAIGQKG